jgi:hypothetical protein
VKLPIRFSISQDARSQTTPKISTTGREVESLKHIAAPTYLEEIFTSWCSRKNDSLDLTLLVFAL